MSNQANRASTPLLPMKKVALRPAALESREAKWTYVLGKHHQINPSHETITMVLLTTTEDSLRTKRQHEQPKYQQTAISKNLVELPGLPKNEWYTSIVSEWQQRNQDPMSPFSRKTAVRRS
jgi:hypothetical protein